MRRTITALTLIAMLNCSCQRGQLNSSDQLKRLIDFEVPVGSTQSQVLAFLDNHDWKYTDQTESQQAIFATLLDPSNQIVRKQFQIAFYLDDHGKLRSYTIKEFLVGPSSRLFPQSPVLEPTVSELLMRTGEFSCITCYRRLWRTTARTNTNGTAAKLASRCPQGPT